MKREDLFRAIGDVDDSLLDENVAPDQPAIWRWIGGITTAAACVAVILGTAGWAKMHQNPPVQTLPEGETAATETQRTLESQSTDVPDQSEPAPTETLLAVMTEGQETQVSTLQEKTVESLDSAETTESSGEELTEPDTPWKAAYRAFLEQEKTPDGNFSMEELHFGLIYVDGDDIPELVVQGYSMVYLYTWADGAMYTLMDGWGFGAMGNAGYEYIPHENALYNHNSDYAGLIGYDTFFHIGAEHEIEYGDTLKTCYFRDLNGNGELDSDEAPEYDEGNVNYFCNDKPISEEEAAPYFEHSRYENLSGELTYAQIMAQLQ